MKRYSIALLVIVCAAPLFAQSYAPSGVQANVSVATVTSGGWTECYRDTYADSNTSLATILSACDQGNLMMACAPSTSPTLSLLAWAPRTDVTYPTGQNVTTVHTANNVEWYFDTDQSWGFAPAGEPVNKTSCDTATGAMHVCWHTDLGAISDGYRCGNNSLNGNAGWVRIVYEAAAVAAAPAVPTASPWALAALALILAATAAVILHK